MKRGIRTRVARAPSCLQGLALCGLVLAVALGTGSAGSASASTVWLCRPGLSVNPCESDLSATAVTGAGTSRVQRARPARRPPIDCFYVYPTASQESTLSADLRITPELLNVARAQAARFSQVCRVYAPVYRQLTITGIFSAGGQTRQLIQIAYTDVAAAWREYLRRFNRGRGVVLIAHSQGSGMLRQLIRTEIDRRRAERRRLVSALLLGGNVAVRAGRGSGGDFQNIPACRSSKQVGCVIAYSSFDNAPPANSLFGRAGAPFGGPAGPNFSVLCTNPAALRGGTGVLRPYFTVGSAAGLLGGLNVPALQTPWANFPGLYKAQCKTANGLTWLQITDVGGAADRRTRVSDGLGPTWGLHLYDINIALGNLVDIVRAETRAYSKRG